MTTTMTADETWSYVQRRYKELYREHWARLHARMPEGQYRLNGQQHAWIKGRVLQQINRERDEGWPHRVSETEGAA